MSANSERNWRYPGWRVASASSVGVFASFASLLVFTFGVFLKPIAAEFGWSREAVSAAFAVAALGVAACSPVVGVLIDRFGARRVIAPCVAIFGLAFASLSILPARLAALYVTFAVLGAVGNGTAQLAHTRAVASWFVERRGLAMAILMMGSAVGAMIWPPTAQWLVHMLGWRPAAASLGAIALLLGLPVAVLFVRENPARARRRGGDRVGVGQATLRQVVSRPFLVIVTILFLGSLGQNGAIIHLSSMLTDRGIGQESAAFAMSAMGAASIAGRIAAGWTLDRFFGPRVAMGLLAVAAAGAFVLAGATTANAGILGAALIGVGMGGEADVTPYLLSRYFGLDSLSTMYGLTWSAYAVAGALGPVLMGRAFDLTGSYSVFLTGLSAVMLGSAALTLLLPRYSDNLAPVAIAGSTGEMVTQSR
jgi:MFS family permease